MKVFKLVRNIILILLLSIVGILEIVVFSIIPIWNAHKSVHIWFGILYQPVVVSLASIPLLPQIYATLSKDGEHTFFFLLIAFEAIALTFAINAIIELIYNLCNKEDIFAKIQELQTYANNYALIIISLAALYVSAFPENSQVDNLLLLLLGAVFFVATISSDIYRIFIYTKGDVKDLSSKIKRLLDDA